MTLAWVFRNVILFHRQKSSEDGSSRTEDHYWKITPSFPPPPHRFKPLNILQRCSLTSRLPKNRPFSFPRHLYVKENSDLGDRIGPAAMTERGRKMGERILKIVRFYQNKNFHVTFSTPDVKF